MVWTTGSNEEETMYEQLSHSRNIQRQLSCMSIRMALGKALLVSDTLNDFQLQHVLTLGLVLVNRKACYWLFLLFLFCTHFTRRFLLPKLSQINKLHSFEFEHTLISCGFPTSIPGVQFKSLSYCVFCRTGWWNKSKIIKRCRNVF